MKRILALSFVLCLLAVSLMGCTSSSSSAAPSVPSTPQSTPSSSAPAGSTPSDTSFTPVELDTLLAPIAEAADLGDTIGLALLDLTASGDVDSSLVVTMAGAQSTEYQTNGGLAAVLLAQPGQAETLKTQLESYRDGLLSQSENYQADFPEAYANMQNAVIAVNGDYVVFATAAAGDVEKLNAAIAATFA